MSTYDNSSHGRVPIIALDYSQRHLRRLKELMIDYKNGNLYIVDDTDINVIYDLTKKIIQNISSSITSDDIIVNIDGVGDINLTKFLSTIQNNMVLLGSESIVSLIPESSEFDNISLELKDHIAQIKLFDKAKNGQIIVKENGEVRWKDNNTSFNDVSVVPIEIEETEDPRITLKTDTMYITSNPRENFSIVFSSDDLNENKPHAKIVWVVECNSIIPTISFPSNVYWEFNTDPTLFENCTGVYTFETFDQGKKWLGKVDKYLITPEAEVTETYIKDKLKWNVLNSEDSNP